MERERERERERKRLTEGGEVMEKGGKAFFVRVVEGGGGGGEKLHIEIGEGGVRGAQWGRTDTERRRESGREEEAFSKQVRILCKSFLVLQSS